MNAKKKPADSKKAVAKGVGYGRYQGRQISLRERLALSAGAAGLCLSAHFGAAAAANTDLSQSQAAARAAVSSDSNVGKTFDAGFM
jgi:hypothetical protein